jgi:hypothetical protein
MDNLIYSATLGEVTNKIYMIDDETYVVTSEDTQGVADDVITCFTYEEAEQTALTINYIDRG